MRWRAALITLLLLTLGLTMATAQGADDPDSPVLDEIRAVLERQMAAARAEDIGAYAATLHPRSPQYETAVEELAALAETYDLRFRLLDVVRFW
jgi:hypothetical protein